MRCPALTPEFSRPPPRSADGPAVLADDGDGVAMAELLSRPDAMVIRAKAADVAVLIRTTLRQRDDVVRYRAWGVFALSLAVPA